MTYTFNKENSCITILNEDGSEVIKMTAELINDLTHFDAASFDVAAELANIVVSECPHVNVSELKGVLDQLIIQFGR